MSNEIEKPKKVVDDETLAAIVTNKTRIHILSQELWTATEFEHRQSVLMMLTASAAELLLLESNAETRQRMAQLREEMLKEQAKNELSESRNLLKSLEND